MGRILGLDVGDKRIGVSISDPLGITAQGSETIQNNGDDRVFKTVSDLVKSKSVDAIVVGLPLMMNGEKGPQAIKILKWVKGLESKVQCPIITWDERLTSKEAQRLMVAQDLSRRKQKNKSDSLASILLLQNYLEFKRSSNECLDE